jgi:hypothetical protein
MQKELTYKSSLAYDHGDFRETVDAFMEGQISIDYVPLVSTNLSNRSLRRCRAHDNRPHCAGEYSGKGL